jgi:glycine cleavage system H protein
MHTPSDLRYTRDHEWVRTEDDGTVVVGITDFAQDALGDIVYVQLPDAAREVAAGESCAEIESVKSVSEIYAPLAGEVVAINEALEAAPETVNADPYGAGWLLRLRVADVSGVDELLDAAAYQAHTGA